MQAVSEKKRLFLFPKQALSYLFFYKKPPSKIIFYHIEALNL